MLKLDIDGFTEVEVLEYLLTGLTTRRQAIELKISGIHSQLAAARGIVVAERAPGKRPVGRPAKNTVTVAPAKPAKPGRKPLSPEARANIIAAQKKRWAKVRKEARAAANAPKTRRGRIQLAPEAGPEPEVALAGLAS